MNINKKSPTDYYHVIIKGYNDKYIYKNVDDKKYFIKNLFKIAYSEEVQLAAWCVMDNHTHLLIKVDVNNFERFFKRINKKYSVYYRNKHNIKGNLYKRLKVVPINSETQLICNMRYIHQNPVKANMVNKAIDYRWSSYTNYLCENTHPYLKYLKDIVGNSNEIFEDFHTYY